jgi:hypothetical protein
VTLYTSDSKTVDETKSYIGDFRDVLVSGETLTSYTVTVTVFSGDDLNPSNLLYQGIDVHPGYIEQRIRLGVPGNIYSIKFEVVTSLGNTYDKVTRFAVLPQDGNATPVFTNIYYTSWPYPIEYAEIIQPAISPNYFHLLLNPRWVESIKGNITAQDSSLSLGAIYYNNYPPENIKSVINPLGGSLISSATIYYNNYIPEQLKNNVAGISGTLSKVVVYYINYQPENIKPTVAPQGGTLI